MAYTLTTTQKAQYRELGYVMLRAIIPQPGIEALKADLRDLVEASARGDGPDIPWINRGERLPERLGQLLRPHWIRPSFISSLEEGPYFPVAEQLLDAPIRYSLFGMLAGGDGKPYVQNWHRDLAPIEGWDSFRAFLDPDAFEWQQLEPLEWRVNGSKVLVRVRVRAQGAASGLELDIQSWMVWTMSDGLGVHLVNTQDEKRALEAFRAPA